MSEKRAAFFDLDGTLTVEDTLFLYLRALRGRAGMGLAFAQASLRFPFDAGNGAEDWRGRLKSAVLHQCLAGVSLDRAAAAAERLAATITWNDEICDRLAWHRAEGHHTVIVTGALEIYLDPLLRDRPHDHRIATQLEIRDGRLTGRMAAANNVRAAKARRVRAYLEETGPYAETWGYGNAPHDLDMLAMMDHRRVI